MTTAEVRLSIVIPTVGRPTLYRTLWSVHEAGIDPKRDEVLVVGDGRRPEAERMIPRFRELFPIKYSEKVGGQVGGTQRNHAISLATGTAISFMDDDDCYSSQALQLVRKSLEAAPERPHVFRMVARAKRLVYDTLWRVPEILEGNVGTPMIVVPNNKERLVPWENVYCGDFHFLKNTAEKYPGGKDSVIWHKDVIAEIY